MLQPIFGSLPQDTGITEGVHGRAADPFAKGADANQPLFRYELGYVSAQSSVEAEERRQLILVKAYHRLSVNQSDRGGHQAALLQFLQRSVVCADVALFELDPLLRKKLLRPFAEHSTGLTENNHLVIHVMPPRSGSAPACTRYHGRLPSLVFGWI